MQRTMAVAIRFGFTRRRADVTVDGEDISLFLKLQQRLTTLERDKASSASRIEEIGRESHKTDVRRAQDMNE